MKDYYETLGVSKNAGPDEIKSAFRRLAFQYHPDRNPGNEAMSEARFKEINEAYSVLCDDRKRREYDARRRGSPTQAGFRARPGFEYAREDVFRGGWADDAVFQEIARIFAQMGLRFDDELRNRTFSGRRVDFRVYTAPGRRAGPYWNNGPEPTDRFDGPPGPGPAAGQQPGMIDRLAAKSVGKLAKFVLRKTLGIDPDLPARGRDIERTLRISSNEAARGCRKRIRYKRGKQKTTIELNVPTGIVSGKKIRLKGMGEPGMESGDLYIHVQVK